MHGSWILSICIVWIRNNYQSWWKLCFCWCLVDWSISLGEDHFDHIVNNLATSVSQFKISQNIVKDLHVRSLRWYSQMCIFQRHMCSGRGGPKIIFLSGLEQTRHHAPSSSSPTRKSKCSNRYIVIYYIDRYWRVGCFKYIYDMDLRSKSCSKIDLIVCVGEENIDQQRS